MREALRSASFERLAGARAALVALAALALAAVPLAAVPLAAVPLAAVPLAAAAAPGGDQRGEVHGVQVRARCPWPSNLHAGWFPIYVELHNGTAETRELSMRVTRTYGGDTQITSAVRLEPGAREHLELLAPAWNSDMVPAQYYLTVLGNDRSTSLSGFGGASSDVRVHPVLYLASRAARAGDAERWSDELAYERLGDDGSAAIRVFPMGVPAPTPAGSSGGSPNIALATAVFEDMPSRFDAYTSLDAVVLDTSGGMPDPRALEPLVAWVRTGGTLVLVGPRARELAEADERLAPWLEERFELQGAGDAVQRVGLGLLAILATADAFPAARHHAALQYVLEQSRSYVPRPGESRVRGMEARLEGIGDLPYRTFTLLLVVFALVIGPINFVVVKRLNRPVLLLATIPGIALVATALLLLYGIFWQGIDTKTASKTLTLLDQRARRAATVDVREIYVGLSPGGGMRPAAGTAILPWVESEQRWNAPRRAYRVAVGGGSQQLTGDFLPARRPTQQVLISESASRLRLVVEREGEALSVENGLDATVDQLVLLDPDGRSWATEAPLAPGERALAVPIEKGEAMSRTQAPLWLGSYEATIAPGARSPFQDDCGLDLSEHLGAHRVVGILDASAEAWR